MKKTLLWAASTLFLASLVLPAPVLADDPPQPPPTCTPGCGKPGASLELGLRR